MEARHHLVREFPTAREWRHAVSSTSMIENSPVTINPCTRAALVRQPVFDLESLTHPCGKPDAFKSGFGCSNPNMPDISGSRKRTLWKQQTTRFVLWFDRLEPFKLLAKKLIDRLEELIH